MTRRHVNPEVVLADLKDFQRRTARWVFERMYDEQDASVRFLVADEVGLGKTHIAKGVIAQAIDHLQRTGDERHDIVYVCSNGAIARQNLRKLVPRGVEPLEAVERLTMLPLAQLDSGDGEDRTGVNLLAITPGTSLNFGSSTGMFRERCLAYTFLRALWGASPMNARARWIFWRGVSENDGDARLRWYEKEYRAAARASLDDFARELAALDRRRAAHGQPAIRDLFDQLAEGLRWKRRFPDELWAPRVELIAQVRQIMAVVGIASLRPDLVILDEFQRFKDLLDPDPTNFAADLAHRLFDFVESDGRQTRTLLLSATPYRMYTTADEPEGDHYADFLATCSFLLDDEAKLERLRERFATLRVAMTSEDSLGQAERICAAIAEDLRTVMARSERLAATPDRDGMLEETDAVVTVEQDDVRSYLRVGDLAERVKHHEPTEYWKAGPYLVNFMERYQLKRALEQAAADGSLAVAERLQAGPGLLSWDDVEAYETIDPQNGRLRWLLEDLERHRAFELLWIPASLPYYEAGSIYETPEATTFTKRLIFSGWALVPKVVSSLVSFEAERRAFAARDHNYSTDYSSRGGQRLMFRTTERTGTERRRGEASGERRAAGMTTFLLGWPSVVLAELGDPRPLATASRQTAEELLATIEARVATALSPLLSSARQQGTADERWYWAAPLFLDKRKRPAVVKRLLADENSFATEGASPGEGFRTHLAEARAISNYGRGALGRPPEDLAAVLAKLALGGPAQCALRAISASTGLQMKSEAAVVAAARAASGFRSFFNAPEVTALVARRAGDARYWRDVIRHCIDGNLQAVLDEHLHVVRDWLGHLRLQNVASRSEAADDIVRTLVEALETRTSSFRVDIPRKDADDVGIRLEPHRMRTRFAVAFGDQSLEDGSLARVGSVSKAFNSPFWPFVLTSTSVGQEGLDFHLWCHAVVHWNLPANPVDLEQREGRVHRYKGHAVRRNLAATVGPAVMADGFVEGVDPWNALFERAVEMRDESEDEMVPFWVFHQGPANIERHVPVLPFSRDAVTLPRLRKTLAAYRLAFGQPRQEELIEFLGADRSDDALLRLASRLRIDLSPPATARSRVRRSRR